MTIEYRQFLKAFEQIGKKYCQVVQADPKAAAIGVLKPTSSDDELYDAHDTVVLLKSTSSFSIAGSEPEPNVIKLLFSKPSLEPSAEIRLKQRDSTPAPLDVSKQSQLRFNNLFVSILELGQELEGEWVSDITPEHEKVLLLFSAIIGHLGTAVKNENHYFRKKIFRLWMDVVNWLEFNLKLVPDRMNAWQFIADKKSGDVSEQSHAIAVKACEHAGAQVSGAPSEQIDRDGAQRIQKIMANLSAVVPTHNSRTVYFSDSIFHSAPEMAPLTSRFSVKLLYEQIVDKSLVKLGFARIILFGNIPFKTTEEFKRELKKGNHKVAVAEFGRAHPGSPASPKPWSPPLRPANVITPERPTRFFSASPWRKPVAEASAVQFTLEKIYSEIKTLFAIHSLDEQKVCEIMAIILEGNKNLCLTGFQTLVCRLKQYGLNICRINLVLERDNLFSISIVESRVGLRLKVQLLFSVKQLYMDKNINSGKADSFYESDDPDFMRCEISFLVCLNTMALTETGNACIMSSNDDYLSARLKDISQSKEVSPKPEKKLSAIACLDLYPLILPINNGVYHEYFSPEITPKNLRAHAATKLNLKHELELASLDYGRSFAIAHSPPPASEIDSSTGWAVANVKAAIIKKFDQNLWTDWHQVVLNMLVRERMFNPMETIMTRLTHMLRKSFTITLYGKFGLRPHGKFYALTFDKGRNRFKLEVAYGFWGVYDEEVEKSQRVPIREKPDTAPLISCVIEIILPAAPSNPFEYVKPRFVLHQDMGPTNTKILRAFNQLEKAGYVASPQSYVPLLLRSFLNISADTKASSPASCPVTPEPGAAAPPAYEYYSPANRRYDDTGPIIMGPLDDVDDLPEGTVPGSPRPGSAP
jgi:hypothetical protein